jgi:aminoglycoside phosphotransferase (APT) family kinase protein
VLGPTDLAVVDRDRDLPALPLLLDAAALSEWLTWQTGEDCRVHPGRLRYKPGTSCVLAFVLERGPDGERTACLARTYHTDQAHKVQKSLAKTHPDAVLAVEHALPLMVTDITGDRDVVALARLRGDRTDLVHDLLPDRDDLATASLTTLSHNPERRWVGLLEGATGAPVVLRAHRRSHFDQHVRGYAPHGAAEPRTPRLLGSARRHALVAVEWVAGRELDLRTADRASLVATGAALAHFHDGHVSRLTHLTPDVQADAVRRGAEQCALLQPALTMEVTALADAINSRLAEMRHPRALLHGDFSADQVVVDDDGSVTLIDLDSAGRGHPAADLGSARAAALVGDVDGVPGALDAVFAGYESVRPLPSAGNLAAHTAAGLVRRAGEPFRRRDPDWAARMTRILELAQRELAGTSVRQGA